MDEKPKSWTEDPTVNRRGFLKTAAGVIAAGYLGSRPAARAEETQPQEGSSNRILPRGTLVVMGGEVEGKEAAVLREGCALSGDAPLRGQTVVCVTSANDDPEGCVRYGNQLFKKELGAEKVVIIESRADADEKVDDVKKARIVRFIGGKQDKLVEAFDGTKAHDEILRRYATDPDFILIGNSAGTAAMSKHMLCRNETTGKDEILEGLKVHDLIIFDMHIIRGRLQRLKEAVAAISKSIQSYILGLGVDEGTALVIQGDKARVVGEGKVYAVGPNDIDVPESGFKIISGSIPGLETPGAYVHGAEFNPGNSAKIPAAREKPAVQAGVGGGR